MDTTLGVIAIICGIIGLLGAVLPVLPGTVISYIGMLCVSFSSYSELSTLTLATWGIVAVVVIVMDYVLPGYFSKKFGGTKAGITGATVGTIVGIFFGVPGIILGPFFGAIAGEMIGSKAPIEKAFKVGMGSMLSFFVGTGIKLVAAVYMLYYIVKVFIAVVI